MMCVASAPIMHFTFLVALQTQGKGEPCGQIAQLREMGRLRGIMRQKEKAKAPGKEEG